MTKVKIGSINPLTRLLNEIPNKREEVPIEQVYEMRRTLGIGMMDATSYLKKCTSVTDAIGLYLNIKRRLVELEEEENRLKFEKWSNESK